MPGLQVMDAVQAGTVEIGHTASYYYVGKAQVLAFDTSVPFGLTARQQNAWMYFGGGIELFRSIFADFGIIQFPGEHRGADGAGSAARSAPWPTCGASRCASLAPVAR